MRWIIFGGVLGLFVLHQSFGLWPGFMFARSSSIIWRDGHMQDTKCLLIRRPQPQDVQIYAPTRGRAQFLNFNVAADGESFSGSLLVGSHVGEEGQRSLADNWSRDARRCPHEVGTNGLSRMVAAPAVNKDQALRSCEFYSFFIKRSSVYIMPGQANQAALIDCVDASQNCTMKLLHRRWIVSVIFPQDKLPRWQKVAEASKKAFDIRLTPLAWCPIRVPFM